MSFKKNSKSKRKWLEKPPLKKYVLYLFIATFLMTGVTFSKYTISRGGFTGARVATFGNLDLYETAADDTRVTSQNYKIIPGVDIIKNPVVSFTSDNGSEMSAYIFVKVNAQNWTFDSDNNSYRILREGDSAEIMNWSIDPDWTFLVSDVTGQVFYRTVPVNGVLDKAPVIKDSKISVSNQIYASQYAELSLNTKAISFTAFAAQAHGFEDVQSAWNSVGGK